jgi:putative flippase GtrA
MSANLSPEADARPACGLIVRVLLREVPRYFIASALALAVDAGLYIGLIRLGGVHYLAAAPAGYALGIAVIYILSIRWVFVERRLEDARSELVLFTLIGLAGLALNQFIIFACVAGLSTTYEVAKLASAAIVFSLNFGGRKLLLFTRFRRPA